MAETDSQMLHWLVERLIRVYGESPNTDFVLRVKIMAREAALRELEERKARENAHDG